MAVRFLHLVSTLAFVLIDCCQSIDNSDKKHINVESLFIFFVFLICKSMQTQNKGE